MAIQSLLTINSKVLEIEKLYVSPLLKYNETIFSSIYCFISRVEPFANNDPTPKQDQQTLKQIQKNIFFAKKIALNNISPVIERIDWAVNTVYDSYTDTDDLFELGIDGKLVKKFYVKNRYDQVFKCLFNNNGMPSTQEPFFEPGNYGKYNIYNNIIDGYKWKYMYTIDLGSKNKFIDANWIPVFDTMETPNPNTQDYGYGAIEVINVLNGGSNYNQPSLTYSVSVDINGDGTGCTAKASVAAGKIRDIIITNPGKNYTYATANVIANSTVSGASANGSGAILQSSVSPIGGHSAFPISELGCRNIMYVCEFKGSENNNLPTDIQYYQSGLINNPVLTSSGTLAQDDSYSVYTNVIVSPTSDTYQSGEIVYQGQTFTNSTCSATVLSYDSQLSLLKLININGKLQTQLEITGNTSGASAVVLSAVNPDFNAFSGYISYIENFDGIQRTVDSNEQIKIILGY